jgi:hypothetical protein
MRMLPHWHEPFEEDTTMKLTRLLMALVFVVGVACAEPSSVVSTWGAWPLCVDGVLATCSWYTPGTETYVLLIQGDTTVATAYTYVVTAILHDGSTKVLQGIGARADNSEGWTMLGPMTFGGIVNSATVTIGELSVIAVGRKVALIRKP